MSQLAIKRFRATDRLFHLFLILTFLAQSATGAARLFSTTAWGRMMLSWFGGYHNTLTIHFVVGMVMTAGFGLHILQLLWRVKPGKSRVRLFGPDSLLPVPRDAVFLFRRVLWFFGLGKQPEMERWAYWEKFDYWAVFWGMPLLAATGVMLMFPVETSRVAPGWSLNVAALLHRAEAILAMSYIFIVHFFIGHLRPSAFPMNEAMFSGRVPFHEARHEKAAWAERVEEAGQAEEAVKPSLPFRVAYYLFGYAALGFGLYLLVNGIRFADRISLH